MLQIIPSTYVQNKTKKEITYQAVSNAKEVKHFKFFFFLKLKTMEFQAPEYQTPYLFTKSDALFVLGPSLQAKVVWNSLVCLSIFSFQY